MELVIWKNHLGSQIVYTNPGPCKKRRLCNILIIIFNCLDFGREIIFKFGDFILLVEHRVLLTNGRNMRINFVNCESARFVIHG